MVQTALPCLHGLCNQNALVATGSAISGINGLPNKPS